MRVRRRYFEIGGEVTGGEMSTRARRILRHSEVSTLEDERRIQLTNLAAARNGWGFIMVGVTQEGCRNERSSFPLLACGD